MPRKCIVKVRPSANRGDVWSVPGETAKVSGVVRRPFCAAFFHKAEKFLQTMGRDWIGLHELDTDFEIAHAIGHARVPRDSLYPEQAIRLQWADCDARAFTEQSGGFHAAPPDAHF